MEYFGFRDLYGNLVLSGPGTSVGSGVSAGSGVKSGVKSGVYSGVSSGASVSPPPKKTG